MHRVPPTNKKRNQTDGQKQKNEMCGIHALHVERSRDISNFSEDAIITSAKKQPEIPRLRSE